MRFFKKDIPKTPLRLLCFFVAITAVRTNLIWRQLTAKALGCVSGKPGSLLAKERLYGYIYNTRLYTNKLFVISSTVLQKIIPLLPWRSKALKYLYELHWWNTKQGGACPKIRWDKSEDYAKSRFKEYCEMLEVGKDSFEGESLVDVGCGPHGCTRYFNTKITIGVDPLSSLYDRYFRVGEHGISYMTCVSEKMPLKDSSVDNVISVNALDHVDIFEDTMKEIFRILKNGGRFIASINLRDKPTIAEPQVIETKRLKDVLAGRCEYTMKSSPVETRGRSEIRCIVTVKGRKT